MRKLRLLLECAPQAGPPGTEGSCGGSGSTPNLSRREFEVLLAISMGKTYT